MDRKIGANRRVFLLVVIREMKCLVSFVVMPFEPNHKVHEGTVLAWLH